LNKIFLYLFVPKWESLSFNDEIMSVKDIRNLLIEKGLKVTPQRLIILEAVVVLGEHPTADNIIGYVKNHFPSISTATVYRALESLDASGLIKKVRTEKDVMRYDAILQKHHHLHGEGTERIEDYFDPLLDKVLAKYFEEKNIPGFIIRDIQVNLTGKFSD